jgi:CubicO group peptidase (beta-lactamase class C family)
MARLAAEIDKLFAQWDRKDSPGASVAVVHKGKPIVRRGYGMASLEHGVPLSPESVIRIGSQTKQFTTFLAWSLIKEGRLGLDDDIRKYHPELPDYERTVRVRHIMHNISGLREFLDLISLSGADARSPIPAPEVSRIMRGQKTVNFAPGDQLMYCNTGFRLLAEIVEKIHGEDMREIMKKRIFEPLGMESTRLMPHDEEVVPRLASQHLAQPDGGWTRGRWGLPIGGEGGAVSTVDDMLVWSGQLVADKPRLGSREIFKAMAEPGTYNNGRRGIYASGLGVMPYRGTAAIGHGGGVAGGRSTTYRYPEHDLAVCILGNLDAINPFTLSRKVADIVVDGALAPLPAQPGEAELKPLGGLYMEAETGDLTDFGVENGVLSAKLGHKTPHWQLAPGVLVPMSGVHDHELRFAKDGNSVELTNSGMKRRYTRLPAFNSAKSTLGEAVGRFVNDGLESEYRIVEEGDGLGLKIQGALGRRSFALVPVAADTFIATSASRSWGGDFQPIVRLVRDGNRISQLHVSTDRTKRLPFERRAGA